MARLLMLVLAVAGLVLSFMAKTPGLLGIGLLMATVGVIGFVFALAADRISANARPESSMASVDELTALRKRTAAAPVRPAAASAGQRAPDRRDDPATG
jgi:hypothetical protein